VPVPNPVPAGREYRRKNISVHNFCCRKPADSSARGRAISDPGRFRVFPYSPGEVLRRTGEQGDRRLPDIAGQDRLKGIAGDKPREAGHPPSGKGGLHCVQPFLLLVVLWACPATGAAGLAPGAGYAGYQENRDSGARAESGRG
jgi:hypothetical protein